jgi:hypothetical protein
MPEIHHVLGAIFRDIAQGVFTSDLYSRNISLEYERDPLLRRFPTPRTEVEEIELELKFAISGFALNPTQDESRESSMATLMTGFSHDLTEILFEHLSEATEKITDFSEENRRKLRSLEYRIYVRQEVLSYLLNHLKNLMSGGKLDTAGADKNLTEILSKWIESLLEGVSASQVNKIKSQILKKIGIKTMVADLEKPMTYIWEAEGDYKLDVEVAAAVIQELPELAISKINVRSTVRNYVWSEYDHEGQTWRALIAE